MKIEEGKYYRTRDGRKVGPIRLRALEGVTYVSVSDEDGRMDDDLFDIISEWTDELYYAELQTPDGKIETVKGIREWKAVGQFLLLKGTDFEILISPYHYKVVGIMEPSVTNPL